MWPTDLTLWGLSSLARTEVSTPPTTNIPPPSPLLSSPRVPTVSYTTLSCCSPDLQFSAEMKIYFSFPSTVKCVGFVGHCITRLFKWDNTRDNIVKLENFAKTRNKIKWELLPAGRPVSGCYETIKIITPGKMTSLKWETELNSIDLSKFTARSRNTYKIQCRVNNNIWSDVTS